MGFRNRFQASSTVVSGAALTIVVLLSSFVLLTGSSRNNARRTSASDAVADASAATTYNIARLDFPAGPDSGEPFLTVSPAGIVYASWLEKGENGHTVFLFSALGEKKGAQDALRAPGTEAGDADSNGSWSAPVKIAEGNNWFVNWADVPSIAVGKNNRMVAHWLERLSSERYAYGIRFSLSSDGGMTWSAAQWLHDDLSGTEHGFATLSMASDGAVDAVWLDGRAMVDQEGGMSIRGRRIDPEGNLQKEVVLDAKTCECCPTTLARLEDGSLLAAYRNRSDTEIRDIAVSQRILGQWSEPQLIAGDGWQISACPVNGPAIDAYGSTVGISWFTAPGDHPVVQVAFRESDGSGFGKAIRINEDKPIGRVGFKMLDEERAVVTWIESGASSSKSSTAGIKMRIIHRDGTLEKAVVVAATAASRASGYPRVSAAGDRIVFLWTEVGDTKRVVSAVARPTI